MRRLYLVRHGETDANLNHIVEGQIFNSPLNEHGREQAKLTGRALADIDLKFIYVSSALRARQTAVEILKNQVIQKTFEREICGLESCVPKFRIHSGLLEINQGDFEGMKSEEIKEKCGDLYRNYKTCPAEIVFPGGESVIQARNRIAQTLTEIMESDPDGNILVVSHGGALALAFICLFGWDINGVFHSLRNDNCGISIIEWPEQTSRPRIVVMNDTCHLIKISER